MWRRVVFEVLLIMAKGLDELAAIGRAELPADAPDARWVRDDGPEFAQLQQEIDRLAQLEANEPVNWRAVVDAAATIIERQSKDLLACSYLCRGLFEREGYPGLAAGLTVLLDVVEHHWEIAYLPKRRARGRGGEVQWLIDNLHQVVEQREPAESDLVALREAAQAIEGLDAGLNDKLGEHAPIFRLLREPVRGYVQALESEAAKAEPPPPPPPPPAESPQVGPKSEPVPAQQAPAPVASAPGSAAPAPAVSSASVQAPSIGSVSSEVEIKKAVKGTQEAINEIAAAWRSLKLSDPRPYPILRFATWMHLAHAPKPPQVQDGKLILPGPSSNQLAELGALKAAGEHAQLIETAERLFANPNAPANGYWLDGHRLVAESLAALGDAFDGARQALILAVRYYIERFPGAVEGVFSNDVPFADEDTRRWLDTEVAPNPANDGTDGSATQAASALEEALEQARRLAGRGEKGEALTVLRDGARQARDMRERFGWQLQQARLCAELGLLEIAHALLEELLGWTDTYRLDDWEPSLSKETLKLLIQCHAKGDPEDQRARSGELRAWRVRLSRLDPLATLELMGRG